MGIPKHPLYLVTKGGGMSRLRNSELIMPANIGSLLQSLLSLHINKTSLGTGFLFSVSLSGLLMSKETVKQANSQKE